MCLGAFTLDMQDTTKGKDEGAFVHMTFSGTEILSEVTAMDKDDPTKSDSLEI